MGDLIVYVMTNQTTDLYILNVILGFVLKQLYQYHNSPQRWHVSALPTIRSVGKYVSVIYSI